MCVHMCYMCVVCARVLCVCCVCVRTCVCVCATSSLSIICWWTLRLFLLAVVNNAAMNTEIYVLFQISGFFFFFFQIYTQNGISGSAGTSIFSFWGIYYFQLKKKTPCLHSHGFKTLMESRADINEDHRSWYTSVTQHLLYPQTEPGTVFSRFFFFFLNVLRVNRVKNTCTQTILILTLWLKQSMLCYKGPRGHGTLVQLTEYTCMLS